MLETIASHKVALYFHAENNTLRVDCVTVHYVQRHDVKTGTSAWDALARRRRTVFNYYIINGIDIMALIFCCARNDG